VTRDGSYDFLNTTFNDLQRSKINFQEIVLRGSSRPLEIRIPPGLSTFYSLKEKDGLLLSYWDSVLSRMITTVDDNTNGFRHDLIPMALSSSDAASRSLLQATLALSSFHIGRQDEALRHKVRAIQSLKESFEVRGGGGLKMAQLSACMMLCVYSVFDASDTTWHLHLQGAKSITDALSDSEKQMACYEFLAPWFDYHNTFSGYSHSADPPLLDGVPNITLPESTPQTRKVIGLLGCSTELLRIIACINQLRTWRASPQWNNANAGRGILELTLLIRSRLQNLKQEIHIEFGETTGTIDHNRITLTAELYRVATLLYLYQVAPTQAIPDGAVKGLVREGFIFMDQMEVCTSPWPLFIMACNAQTDSDRLKILGIVDTADAKRRVGNYQLIKGLFQAVWKQQDLAADEKTPTQVDWRTLVDSSGSMPSFI
jgi:hypothetical protein